MKYDVSYLTTEAVSLLKSLIAIPSISREETQAADYLQNYIEAEGMTTGRKGNNIWCLSPMFDLKKPTILLNSHIDTVKPVNGWRKAPFTPREENGKLYGLGSNDAGASVVTLLQVFLQLCRTEQSYNLIYLASCEEEVSGKDGIESVLKGLPPFHLLLWANPPKCNPPSPKKVLWYWMSLPLEKRDMLPATKVTMLFTKYWMTLPGFATTVSKKNHLY